MMHQLLRSTTIGVDAGKRDATAPAAERHQVLTVVPARRVSMRS